MATTALQPHLEWTGDPDADRLVSQSPTALLIGFCLDQQVPIEWAFLGPLRMQERLGTFDATEIAGMDPDKVVSAFVQPPALHRFPASMARRVYGLCQVIADEYGGDPTRIWTEAKDAKELQRRFAALPGFGAAKARVMVGVVAKHLGARPAGWEAVAPDWPTLADVSTIAEREAYQTQKRAFKAQMRAEAATKAPAKSPAKSVSRKQAAKPVSRGRR
ncbi:MAG TPA: HhH-GPD-type base excision DNA repair protein [Candidatus Saccharimonadales bacterium]|nr:HhH-GPD-type base excision DNA repair protein [Candidatus Saccharimonadales bacterium]